MFKHNWTIEDFRPIIETCLDQFGSERCMFGSNFPVDSLYSDYDTLMSAFKTLIPKSSHESIFKKTAREFYAI